MDLFSQHTYEVKKQPLRNVAKAALIILLLYVFAQFLAIYQTLYLLRSPLVPGYQIWEINKQFVYKAFIGTSASLIAVVLYFYKQYMIIVILVILSLIIASITHIKPTSDFDLMFF